MAVTKTDAGYVSTRKRVKAAAEAKPPVAKKKIGRPAGSKNKVQKPVDWEALAKKLQRALAAEIRKTDELEWAVGIYKQHIDYLESRSWFQRAFNLKG